MRYLENDMTKPLIHISITDDHDHLTIDGPIELLRKLLRIVDPVRAQCSQSQKREQITSTQVEGQGNDHETTE